MHLDAISQKAANDIGGYLLTHYRDARGTLNAVNGTSALGALAGIFAQIQARALMRCRRHSAERQHAARTQHQGGRALLFWRRDQSLRHGRHARGAVVLECCGCCGERSEDRSTRSIWLISPGARRGMSARRISAGRRSMAATS
jgi:hypothetical protein